MIFIAVIHPVLGGELDTFGTLDRVEGNLLDVVSLLDGSGEQRLIADIFFAIHKRGLDVDALEAGIKADARREIRISKWVGNLKLRVDWATVNLSGFFRKARAEQVFPGRARYRLAIGHRNVTST